MTPWQYVMAIGGIAGVCAVVALLIVVAFNGMSSPYESEDDDV